MVKRSSARRLKHRLVWILGLTVLLVGWAPVVIADTSTIQLPETSLNQAAIMPPPSQCFGECISVRPEFALGGVALAITLSNDANLAQLLQAPSPATINVLPRAISELGGGGGMLAMHAILYRYDKELAERSMSAVATASAATLALKVLFGRERPDIPNSKGSFTGVSFSDNYHSMPSGHTTAAFAMASVLARHDPTHAAWYYTGATLVGLSRIHLARHWPSDVVAGALVGLGVGQCF